MHAGGAPGQQAEALAQPLDILVGTPQKVVQHAEKVRMRCILLACRNFTLDLHQSPTASLIENDQVAIAHTASKEA